MNIESKSGHTIVPADTDVSKWIVATLSGGPHAGQTVRVPADEWHLTFQHDGKPYVYRRFNDAPIFHHESAIVKLLGGRKR